MIIIKNKLIPFGSYSTINLFGILFTKSDYLDAVDKRHEKIHSIQILEMTIVTAILLLPLILIGLPLWSLLLSPVSYYLWYGFEYMMISVLHDTQKCSYRDVSFEEEAYAGERDIDYFKNRKPFAWFKYIKAESNHTSNCCKK